MRLFRRRELRHETAWQLLPWLAQGTLEDRELRGTLEHLKYCEVCREELRYLPELRAAAPPAGSEASPDPDAAFRRLIRRVEAFEDRQARTPGSGTFLHWVRTLDTPAAVWAGLLLVLALGTGWMLRPGPEAALFRVLSDEAPATSPDAAQLRVVFAPETPELRLREILLSVGAELADGPSPTGVYTLRLPSAQGVAQDELARLRSLPEIRFLEPIFAPQETGS